MSEAELRAIADNAQMIVSGYAFTKRDDGISILNLNDPDSAMLISEDGKLLETNMPPIEQVLVMKYWERNSGFMEVWDA